VLQRIDHNANVPRPHDQISGARVPHARNFSFPANNSNELAYGYSNPRSRKSQNQVRTVLRPARWLLCPRAAPAMERPSSTVNNRVADGFSCGASAFCALADATTIRHTSQSKGKTLPHSLPLEIHPAHSHLL